MPKISILPIPIRFWFQKSELRPCLVKIYGRAQKPRYRVKTIETKVVCLETSSIRRTWWTLIGRKSSSAFLLYRLIYKININDVFILCYLELGKRCKVVRPTVGKPGSSSLFSKIFITKGRAFVELWIILCLPMELTYRNPTSIRLKSLARLNLSSWKLCYRLLTYVRICAEIFRSVSTREMEIHMILYFKTDSLVKSLRCTRSNCSLWHKYTIIKTTYCTKNITLISSNRRKAA
jgi:hypothetical protein